jgi:RND family efflux transporter MFP subunit
MTTEEQELNMSTVERQPPPPQPASKGLSLGLVIVIAVACAALGALVNSGLKGRAADLEVLTHSTSDSAPQVVSVIHPSPASPTQEIILPGSAQPFAESPIYARANGYLKTWHFDIGARVKKGDLLAEIETPELDQQLQQARADLETAAANFHLAETTAERWQFLLKSNSVSKQEADQTQANMNAQRATVAAQTANVRRLEQLQSFEKVYAPFDGVITARNTDIGALINASAGGQGKELFHLADIRTLRVMVAVPELYANAARPGAKATLTLDEYAGRVFTGTLARSTNSIEASSRTLLVEVDVDNPEGLILPGAYTLLHLNLPGRVTSLSIPSNTLLFRKEGLNVALLSDGHAVLTPITIGRDFGDKVEVVVGLKASDSVIVDPSDSLVSGATVRLATDEPMNSAPGGRKQ